MKTFALIGLMALAGCAYQARQFPLQPGEKIIFNDAARAAEYRVQSGNDRGATNRVVEITRPCAVTCE